MDEVTLLKEYIAHIEGALESSLALNKAQASRPWVGLTDEEVAKLARHELWTKDFVRVIEAKLKEKNT